MDCTVHGILQARILAWVAFPFSRGSSQPRDQTQVSLIAGRFFTRWATGKPKNTGVGSLSLLQQIFLTQELHWGLLHCRWILYQLSYQGSPIIVLGFPQILRWSTWQIPILSMCVCCVLVTQSCLTLCDPMDCSPPGSSAHGILQGRILEWLAIPFSRGSSWPEIEPGSPALQEDSLPSEPPGISSWLIICKQYLPVKETGGHPLRSQTWSSGSTPLVLLRASCYFEQYWVRLSIIPLSDHDLRAGIQDTWQLYPWDGLFFHIAHITTVDWGSRQGEPFLSTYEEMQ